MNFFKSPKKSLGQNFLMDQNIINKIIKIGNIKKNKTVLEIGPGRGSLTRGIVNINPKKIFAVEKDFKLTSILKENSYDPNVLEDITSIVAANGQKSDYKIFLDCYLNAEKSKIERRYLNYLSLFSGKVEISLTLE